MGAVISIARSVLQKTEDAIAKSAADGGKPDVIMAEGETNWASDMLWIIEKGCVDVLENGEFLGKLRAGQVFGAAVAFGHLETQPFTVKLSKSEDGVKLVCWCVPHASVRYTQRQFPEAHVLLEERVADQFK